VSQASPASIRADLLQNYSELFGTRTIDGRKVNVEELVAQLTRDTREEFAELMKARHERHGRVASKQLQYDFLDLHVTVTDPDGNRATVADIRQGMPDAFFERKTRKAWRVAQGRPIPKDVTTAGLEGTGPSIDLGMAMGALNSGASSWMWDWEDAGGDYKDQEGVAA